MKIQYTLIRKRIKNIYLRVREDGTVEVSAPYSVTTEQIEKLIAEKQEFIQKAQKKVGGSRNFFQGNLALKQLERLYYLGKEYRWRICPVPSKRQEEVRIEGDCILIFSQTEQRAEAILKTWYKNMLVMKIRKMSEEIYPFFRQAQPTFPMIQYRNMTSRWGSCNKAKGRLTFNLRLIQYPEKCIEYVVWHEFVHFLHPNHSTKFYETLGSFMPDYKVYRNRLKEKPDGNK